MRGGCLGGSLSIVRRLLLVACMVVGSGGCSESGGARGSDQQCSAACVAVLHFTSEIGVPVEADVLDVQVCRAESCAGGDMPVPADTGIRAFGADPSVTVSLTWTDQPVASDLRGVYEVHATWSSSTERFAAGDIVGLTVRRTSGSNVAMRARSLDSDETSPCGCGPIDVE